jgi:hypothetical protein
MLSGEEREEEEIGAKGLMEAFGRAHAASAPGVVQKA